MARFGLFISSPRIIFTTHTVSFVIFMFLFGKIVLFRQELKIKTNHYYEVRKPEVLCALNPQAVGLDSVVPFSLSNLLKDFLQPVIFKMPRCQIQVLNLMFHSSFYQNMSHICKLRYRKKFLENFRKFISQKIFDKNDIKKL